MQSKDRSPFSLNIPTQEKPMSRPLKIFMRGKRIAFMQEILHRMGYPMQDQKGLFGVNTRDAIKDVQKQRGLKQTGQVDDDLFHLMQHGTAPQVADQASTTIAAAPPDPGCDQEQFDALIRLLLRKGVIEAGELEAEMNRAYPSTLS